MRRATLKSLLLATALMGAGAAQAAEFDLVILGGQVVDGTGAGAYRADLAIEGDRIVRIARDGLKADDGDAVLDARGLIVAPGFIDNHAHIADNIHEYPLAENFVRQGITSIIASLHSGPQPYPLKPYIEALKVAPNVGFFAGHSFARTQVLGMENRAPTPGELASMQKIIADTMADGALGMSTGLVYVPANYAKPDEVIAMAKVAACWGGIYVSHMRDEGAGVLDSVAEVIEVADKAGLPGQINHHKAMGSTQWGWSVKTLAMIDEARARGLDITHDLYPYSASSSSSAVMFPAWALAGGPEGFKARLEDPEVRAKVEAEMMRVLMVQRGGADLERLQFRSLAADPSYNGKTLADLARDRGLAGTPEDAIQLLIELQLKGGFTAIYHVMDEADVVRILQHPLAMIETDGDPVGFGDGFPHPRTYGAFPRVLARYVREQKVLTLEDAVRRMTSLAADQVGQTERGRLAEGAFADITVFDAETIADKATFEDPHQYAVGIRHVVINGVPVIRAGALTGAMPGRPLLGPARPDAVRADPATPGCPKA
ncbi:N-acyl-D-amino-acid deacylase family protein [Phenylobacterium sp.]|uniref:N-acyl-D-amino-acid deacylase family protein n=1 Tax=Phenylobacterium sp. TaxID=1871053 RepID=UPI003003843E